MGEGAGPSGREGERVTSKVHEALSPCKPELKTFEILFNRRTKTDLQVLSPSLSSLSHFDPLAQSIRQGLAKTSKLQRVSCRTSSRSVRTTQYDEFATSLPRPAQEPAQWTRARAVRVSCCMREPLEFCVALGRQVPPYKMFEEGLEGYTF